MAWQDKVIEDFPDPRRLGESIAATAQRVLADVQSQWLHESQRRAVRRFKATKLHYWRNRHGTR